MLSLTVVMLLRRLAEYGWTGNIWRDPQKLDFEMIQMSLSSPEI